MLLKHTHGGNTMSNFIINALPGIIIAIFASFLTSSLALQKFYSEKWWERKEKAYTEIIDALYHLITYCEVQK